jgi:16S rRNA (uracil1498-N3)-methyltransferase
MRRRFFVDKFEGNAAAMRGETADHLGRVLRAEVGQLYELSDGSSVWVARVSNVKLSKGAKSAIDFELVEEIPARESGPRLQLAISVVKFERFEWCLEKATELGVAEITPLAAARSDKALIGAAAKRRARWEKILVEAAQQSRQVRAPILRAAIPAVEAFREAKAEMKVLLSERADAKPMREILRSAQPNDAVLAFGPEGGWTDDEIAVARGAGFAEASLGEEILRTETAVIAALAVVRFVLKASEPKT